MSKLNGLDLFSGIGGIGIALSEWVRTVAYCEQDRYAQGVLLSRMQSGDIDQAPIWDDVSTLNGDLLPRIDIIFGGFPCQDISVAGLGKGLEGKRSGLFFEIIRLVEEVSPRFVFLENVPAIRTRGLSEVVHAFTEIGYDCRWTCLSAASVGAPHKRERWFLLAHANSLRKLSEQREHDRDSNSCQDVAYSDNAGSGASERNFNENRSPNEQEWKNKSFFGIGRCCENVAYARSERVQGLRSSGKQESGTHGKARLSLRESEGLYPAAWNAEPSVGRVVNGLPNRSHRIKCLGNSVVPLQVKTAFEKLIGL